MSISTVSAFIISQVICLAIVYKMGFNEGRKEGSKEGIKKGLTNARNKIVAYSFNKKANF